MNLRRQLTNDDPVRREEPLADEHVRILRQRTLAAAQAREHSPQRSALHIVLPAFCLAAAVLVASVVTRAPDITAPGAAVRAEDRPISRIYFETPSGMRVVWTFDTRPAERPHP